MIKHIVMNHFAITTNAWLLAVTVEDEEPHEVHPAALKVAMRLHLERLCGSLHCVDSLVFYLNSPARTDGTMLLWDIDNDGEVTITLIDKYC